MHETLEELLDHPPGAGLRRALHPGRGARARAGADEHQRVHPRGEGPDRRADRRLPLQPRLRQDPVAAGAARHRRAPRRDAAEVPPAGRAARAGRPAQGHLRHRHPRRRHQRADPHRAVHRPVQVRRHAGSGSSRRASSTRSPGRAGRAGFDTAGTVVVQAPEHVVENDRLRREGRRRPEEAKRKVQRKKPPEGFVTWTEDTFERLVAAEPEPLVSRMRVSHAMLLNVIARAGRPVRGDAAAAARQPRGRAGAAAAHPAGGRASTARCSPPASSSASTRRTRTAARSGSSRTCSSTSRSTSRCRRSRSAAFDTARPGGRRRTPSTWCRSSRRRWRTRGRCSAPRSTRPAARRSAEMKADGIEYDERMELLEEVTWPKPLAGAARARLRDLPAAATRGSPTTRCRRSRWCATCTSGR